MLLGLKLMCVLVSCILMLICTGSTCPTIVTYTRTMRSAIESVCEDQQLLLLHFVREESGMSAGASQMSSAFMLLDIN